MLRALLQVILGAKYGMPIDMWSFGCILAELLTGYPLLPGEDEGDQLALMMELLGIPPPKVMDGAKRLRTFFTSRGLPRYCDVTVNSAGEYELHGGRSKRGKHRGPPGSKDMVRALKGCEDVSFVDFLTRCLDWDPQARMTPAQALKHPWLRRKLPKPPGVPDISGASVGPIRAPTTRRGSDATSFHPTALVGPHDPHQVRFDLGVASGRPMGQRTGTAPMLSAKMRPNLTGGGAAVASGRQHGGRAGKRLGAGQQGTSGPQTLLPRIA